MNSENLSYNTIQGPLNGELEVPTSKSYANRVLVLAALNENPVTISNIPESSDVINMISCFKKIGLEIEINSTEVIIRNSFPCTPINFESPHNSLPIIWINFFCRNWVYFL